MTNIIVWALNLKKFCSNMSSILQSPSQSKTTCHHCGDDCLSESIAVDGKYFCCNGCKTVFEILSANALCDYYELENRPGINMNKNSSSASAKRFDYLDDAEVQERLLDFKDETIAKVQFYLPQIHCSACIWLLENLYKINPTIRQSRVNFLKKEVYLTFEHQTLALKELVRLMATLGYEPKISLNDLEEVKKKSISKHLIYQVGLAGFAFGNIMLMSLPEYFGLDADSIKFFSPWFGWINLGLATPVAIYSGQDYFKSAWFSLRQKRLNIDVPIALGVLVLYIRSAYEVISQSGPGFFDSLCGLLFFLLLGRIFQEKVYHQLSFERDYRSYFPISISKWVNGQEDNIPLKDIKKGDKIIVKNGELIPVDALLLSGKANIDNSFATGESDPIKVETGHKIYAGGRQVGEAIRLEVIRPLNQSKLTRLWSDYAAKEKSSSTFSSLTDRVSQYFTPIILIVALAAGVYHFQHGIGTAIEVMSAVLIVACPCALALAAPFTFGHATRWLGKNDCYLREAAVLEKMADIDQLVFDKTGTLTYSKNQGISYSGKALTEKESMQVSSLVAQSNHPLSRHIYQYLKSFERLPLDGFEELPGKGIQAVVDGELLRIGSAQWIFGDSTDAQKTSVFIEINNQLKGSFSLENEYRKGIDELIKQLANKYQLSLLSGDNSNQEHRLKAFFPSNSQLLFNQQPQDKLKVITELQKNKQKVMMVGDGLNDAGALRQADVGMAIAEDVNAFSPACDAILGANSFERIGEFLRFAVASKKIVYLSFVLSFLYNALGLGFAVQGLLSPVFAAILMPISSISVVAFVSLSVWISGKWLAKNQATFSTT